MDGRIDVTHDTRIDLTARDIVSTDNPGSPNLQAGLAKLPLFTTFGGTAGIGQRFSRLELEIKGDVDRTIYQNSSLTDGNHRQQRGPPVQSIWRPDARQLRADAGRQAIC